MSDTDKNISEQPRLYILAGCNGAGKTTASMVVLPEILHCTEFVNADEIAKGLSPFNPESVAIEAGRLMLKRINYLLAQKATFAIETTLSTRSYQNLVKRAHDEGYNVILLFFWLPAPEMAVLRVAERVTLGGHNIPTDVIYRRYYAGIKNLIEIFVPIVDEWSVYDNSKMMSPIVDKNIIIDQTKYQKIIELCQNRKK